MARTVAELPKGSRITDYISLGVLNTMIPRTAVDAALEASSRQSIRQRDLPAHVMVYYVIALALYMQSSYREVLRCLLEGLQWLSDPSARLELIRFRGHLSSWRGGGVHNAEVETAVRGGIPTADGRAGSVRTYTGRAGSGVRAVGRGDTKLGRAGWSRRRRADRRPEHRRQRGVASTAPGEPASARRT